MTPSITSYHSPLNFGEIVTAFSKGNPIMAFEYVLQITPVLNTGLLTQYSMGLEATVIPLTAFGIPDAGVGITSNPSYFGGFDYSLSTGTMQVSYVSNALGDSVINGFWANQFTDSGALSLSALANRPTITITNNKTGKAIVTMDKCMFTFPKPEIKIGSSDLAVFTTTISYKNIIIANK